MTPKLEKLMEELNNFIGDSPDVPAFIKDDTCFVCGQPYNKSPQFEELKKLLAEKITQVYQSAIDDAIKCVPEEKQQVDKEDPDNYGACYAIAGFNDCHTQTLNNLEKLR